jgi:IS30 family transposase
MSAEERAVLQLELDRGSSLRSIGRRLGRSASTLSREVGLLGLPSYSAHLAGEGCRQRRRRSARSGKLPKGVDLSQASQEYLNHVAALMNGRPRKTLGWATPLEAMEKEIAEFKSRVALDS